ncbi:flavodoxin family protein [bacterium]|nr:flavodoxin family protein [bacterium]
MRLTILDGAPPGTGTAWSRYLNDFTAVCRREHAADLFHLATMDLRYCRGCWNCWWTTPGECVINDEADTVLRSVINADLVVFASPLIAGFTSSLLKKVTDRLIVLVHPYIELRNGESHHMKRYERYPDFGVLLQKEACTDDDDVRIVSDIYDRLAVNFHSRVRFVRFREETTVGELRHAACGI